MLRAAGSAEHHKKKEGTMRTSQLAATAIALTVSMLIIGCSGIIGNDGGGGTGNAPAKVIDLSANSSDGEVSLSWFDPYASDLDHIEIAWQPEDGKSQPKIVSSDGTLDILLTGLHDPGTNGPEKNIAELYWNDGSGNLTSAGEDFTAVSDSSSNFGDVDN
jgi:hypothetical protein